MSTHLKHLWSTYGAAEGLAVGDARLFVAEDHRVWCADLSTGDTVWSTDKLEGECGRITLTQSVVTVRDAWNVTSFDPATGARLSSDVDAADGGPVDWGTPPDGFRFSDDGRELIALGLDEPFWRRALPERSPLVHLAPGCVVVNMLGGALLLDVEEGGIIEEITVPSPQYDPIQSVSTMDRLVVATSDGEIRCYAITLTDD